MSIYNSQYYFITSPSGKDEIPFLNPDTNTEDRRFRYEPQPVSSPPLRFVNGWRDENIKKNLKERISTILFEGSNLVVHSSIRENLLNYEIQGMHMHPSIYIDDKQQWHEDYWYLTFSEMFDCWDRSLSDYETEPLEMGGFKLHSVYTYSLNQEVLEKKPLKERLLFKMGGTQDGFIVCHESILRRVFGQAGKNGAEYVRVDEY